MPDAGVTEIKPKEKGSASAARRGLAPGLAPVLAGMLLLGALTAGKAAGQTAGLFRSVEPATAIAAPVPSPDSLTLRRRLVAIDFGQLTPLVDAAAVGAAVEPVEPLGVLRLNLFDDATFTGLAERIAPTFSGGYSLSGQLAGIEMGTVTLVVNGDVVAGTLWTPEATYRIWPVANGLHTVSQLDRSAQRFREVTSRPSATTTNATPLPSTRLSRISSSIDPADEVPRTDRRIDLLVVYTRAVRQAKCFRPPDQCVDDDHTGIMALIDLWVAVTNQALADSGVIPRINVVSTLEADVDVDSFPQTPEYDPAIKEVHASRDRHGADLVMLIRPVIEEGIAEGAAPVIEDPYDPENSERKAFGHITHNATGDMFAHELGHMMGVHHDRYQEVEYGRGADYVRNQWWPYSFGYVNQSAFEPGAADDSCWTTIMAYGTQCGHAGRYVIRLPRFSNPDQSYPRDAYCVGDCPTDPLGVPGDESTASTTGPADARRTFNETSVIIANYRAATSGRPPRIVGTLPDLRLSEPGATVGINVSRAFADPDGDVLGYLADSSSAGVVTPQVQGAWVTLKAGAEGTATVRVTATDPLGFGTEAQEFAVTVKRTTGSRALNLAEARSDGSRGPPRTISPLPDLRLPELGAMLDMDLSRGFADPDGEPLSYDALTSSWAVIDVQTVGAWMTLRAVGEGRATVDVEALDPGRYGVNDSARFTVTVGRPANRPPVAVGTLPSLTVRVDDVPVVVDVAFAFSDPDGDRLAYSATSAAGGVAVFGSVVTVTPVAAGSTSTVQVTATDPGGLSAMQQFTVTVSAAPPSFTDDPIRPGVTPVKAVHFTELRTRIDMLRAAGGLRRFRWTDRVLRPGVTPVKLAHLVELREALDEAFSAAGRPVPGWTDAAPVGGATPIRAVHLTELRSAVVALE